MIVRRYGLKTPNEVGLESHFASGPSCAVLQITALFRRRHMSLPDRGAEMKRQKILELLERRR